MKAKKIMDQVIQNKITALKNMLVSTISRLYKKKEITVETMKARSTIPILINLLLFVNIIYSIFF